MLRRYWMADVNALEARVAKLEVEFRAAVQCLRLIEWDGYDAAADRRCCPVCRAAADRGRDHRYACTLAIIIGAPMQV